MSEYYKWHFSMPYDDFLEITNKGYIGEINVISGTYNIEEQTTTGIAIVSFNCIRRENLKIVDLYSDIRNNVSFTDWISTHFKLFDVYETILSDKWTHRSGAVFNDTKENVWEFCKTLAKGKDWDEEWETFVDPNNPKPLKHPVVDMFLETLDWVAIEG